MKDNLIRDKSYEFALMIIQLYKTMIQNNEFVLSKQILRPVSIITYEFCIFVESLMNLLLKLLLSWRHIAVTDILLNINKKIIPNDNNLIFI